MIIWGRLLRHPTVLAGFLATGLGGCIFPCNADGTCGDANLVPPQLDPTVNQSAVVTIERSTDKTVLITCAWQAEQTTPAWVCDGAKPVAP